MIYTHQIWPNMSARLMDHLYFEAHSHYLTIYLLLNVGSLFSLKQSYSNHLRIVENKVIRTFSILLIYLSGRLIFPVNKWLFPCLLASLFCSTFKYSIRIYIRFYVIAIVALFFLAYCTLVYTLGAVLVTSMFGLPV